MVPRFVNTTHLPSHNCAGLAPSTSNRLSFDTSSLAATPPIPWKRQKNTTRALYAMVQAATLRMLSRA